MIDRHEHAVLISRRPATSTPNSQNPANTGRAGQATGLPSRLIGSPAALRYTGLGEGKFLKLISLRAKTAAGAFAVTVAAVLATATPAQAATYNVTDNCDVPWITCSYGDLRLFYNSKDLAIQDGYYKSAFTSFYANVDDHWGTSQYQGSSLTTYRYVFGNGGNGNGQYTKNNAASVENCARDDNYRVYYNSGFGGTSQYFAANGPYGDCNITNLISALKNNNASSHFG